MKPKAHGSLEIMLGRKIIRHSGATLGGPASSEMEKILTLILGGIGPAALDELPQPVQDILVGPAATRLLKRGSRG